MISREELIQKLRAESKFYSETDIPYYRELFKEAADAISALSQPERPRGRWVPVWHGEFIATLECSACGRRINVDYPLREKTIKRKFPYCHCGADMRGEEE